MAPLKAISGAEMSNQSGYSKGWRKNKILEVLLEKSIICYYYWKYGPNGSRLFSPWFFILAAHRVRPSVAGSGAAYTREPPLQGPCNFFSRGHASKLKILYKQASGNLSMGTLQSSLPHYINAQSETIQILLSTSFLIIRIMVFFFLVLEIASTLKEKLSLFQSK